MSIQPTQITPVATRLADTDIAPADTDIAPDHPTRITARLTGSMLRSVGTSGHDNAYDCVYTWAYGFGYHRCPTWGEVRAELPRLIVMYGRERFDEAFIIMISSFL
jgi:hypothetical protein